ncbi:hypothetical protein ACFLTP_09090 [Chloroflexota bacterium]
MPSIIREAIESFVDYYDYQSYHKASGYITPAGVYFGKKESFIVRKNNINKGHYRAGKTVTGMIRRLISLTLYATAFITIITQ